MATEHLPIKVLTVGSALGSISALFSKVSTINTKNGPFQLLLCVGDFFGGDELNATDEGKDEVKRLLDGQINVPIPTYIMQGSHALPSSIISKFVQTGGEICKNLTLIGKANVLTLPQGLRIACFGGRYEAVRFNIPSDPNSHTLSSPYITADILTGFLSSPQVPRPPTVQSTANEFASLAEAKAALKDNHIDILLTHTWPTSVTNHCGTLLPLPEAPTWGRPEIEQVVTQLRPRYHFAAAGGDPPAFWERKPFMWDGEGGQAMRFISLGEFGGPEPQAGKKQRWFYAFSIAPQGQQTLALPRPANATPCPFPARTSGTKRTIEADSGENFIWGGGHQDKRIRRDGKQDGQQSTPPSGYKCKICESGEHFIKDCPQKSKPPEGYICRKCQQPGHLIRDCPELNAVGNTGGKKPPDGYVCRACGSEGHFIRDCPFAASNTGGGRREPRKEIGPDECWFCLSNPRLTKHLIVSIGSECYLTLPKGQLPDTSSGSSSSPIPGGGHVLIIPISHYPTLQAVPSELSLPIIIEIERYKSALRTFFAKHGSLAVIFEVARLSGKGGHAHVQVIPVPEALGGTIEEQFKTEGSDAGMDWEEDPDAALEKASKAGENYFRVDLPDGRKMVHILKYGKPFNLQFGRITLANLLGLQNRIDWKACAQTEAEEKKDALAFKAAFAAFDPAA